MKNEIKAQFFPSNLKLVYTELQVEYIPNIGSKSTSIAPETSFCAIVFVAPSNIRIGQISYYLLGGGGPGRILFRRF